MVSKSVKISSAISQPVSQVVSSDDIPCGQAFIGKVGMEPYGLYLKTSNGVVLLEDAMRTWKVAASVQDYRPVNIEIRIV